MVGTQAPRSPFAAPAAGKALIAGLALALLPLTGCPDPAGKFDDYVDRTKDDRDVKAEEVGGGAVVDVSGTFLFALTPIPVSADLYLQFLSTNTFTANDDGTGTLKMVLTPLTLDLQSTDGPRVPIDAAVSPPIVADNIAVAADGTFVADLGQVSVSGTANPISGSEILANLQLQGVIRDENFVCGNVTGDVLQPIQVALAGTFGSERVDEAAATDPSLFPVGDAIKGSCEAGGVIPDEDADAGGEEGGDTDAGTEDGDVAPDTGGDTGGEGGDADAAGPTVACTDEDLSGTYDLQFKTAAQENPSDVRMVLTASGDDNCYTGTIESKSTDDTLATVTHARLEDGELIIFLLDFQIPPGQSPLLPNGGVADVTLTATTYTVDAICGDIVFSLKEPLVLESAGGFAAAKVGGPAVVEGPSCDDLTFPTNEDCPTQDLVGDWDLFFKTAAQTAASSVTMTLASDPTNCFVGDVISKSSGDKLSTVESFLLVEGGGSLIIFRDFIIPPGQSPLLPNGGKADVELTPTTLTDTEMCGDILYKLKEPFATTSAGTFAAAKNGSGATVDGHTCDDLTPAP